MKDILIFDDPQKDEFIEYFKTPPISPIALEKIRGRQGNVYIHPREHVALDGLLLHGQALV